MRRVKSKIKKYVVSNVIYRHQLEIKLMQGQIWRAGGGGWLHVPYARRNVNNKSVKTRLTTRLNLG